MSNKKIVMLARYLPAHGSTTHMYTLSEELIQLGHKVTIISGGPDNSKSSKDLFEESKTKGIEHYVVKFPIEFKKGKIGKIKMLFKYILSYPTVSKYIRKNKIDYIHCHYPVTTFIPAVMRIFNRKYKFVVTHHISGIPKHVLNRKGNGAIAISDELELELDTIYRYPKEKIFKVYNGVSEKYINLTEDKTKYKDLIDVDKNKFLIGFVGTFNERKGIDILLDSLIELKFEYQAVFLGEGKYLSELLLKDKYKKIKENIIIRGFSDPTNYYRAFDCLVLPSRQEGFPLVVIEAMLSNTTVIRSNVEGANQQIEHGRTGFLFENENFKKLRENIELIYNDKILNNIVAKNGQKSAIQKFTAKKMAINTLDVYKEVLDNEKN